MLAATRTPTEADVRRALDVVLDPELDEPITDLGFVRSIALTGAEEGVGVEVHLRLPTSFCSPSFAYLMVADAKDALVALLGGDGSAHVEPGRVRVELDDHHDSDRINAGLAADAGYRGTFGVEAEDSLDELRAIFRRKAHTAAMERCLTALLRADADLAEADLGTVVLADLPDDTATTALRRRRTALGLPGDPASVVMVDEHGAGYGPDEVPMALRRARSTRISIDGNAHFCRGLLATRYPGSEADQAPRAEETFFPLSGLHHSLKEHSA